MLGSLVSSSIASLRETPSSRDVRDWGSAWSASIFSCRCRGHRRIGRAVETVEGGFRQRVSLGQGVGRGDPPWRSALSKQGKVGRPGRRGSTADGDRWEIRPCWHLSQGTEPAANRQGHGKCIDRMRGRKGSRNGCCLALTLVMDAAPLSVLLDPEGMVGILQLHGRGGRRKRQRERTFRWV